MFKSNKIFISFFNKKPRETIIKNVYSTKSSPKAFSEVPSLKEFPVLGHTYLFLPGGRYSFEKFTEAVQDISKTLGPIFKLNLGGMNLLITTDADYTETLFRNEGSKPLRQPFPALCYYRRKMFNSTGVVPGNGEEWYRLRKGVNPLLKFDMIKAFYDRQDAIARKFVKFIKKNRTEDGILENLFENLMKYTIEAISVVSPGHQFNTILGTDQESLQIIKASNDFMEGLYSTLVGFPLWRIYKTVGYRKLESSHQVILRVIGNHITNLKKIYDETPNIIKENHPFMCSLFENNSLSKDDILMLAMEVFFGGIDAAATTIAFSLFYLAKDKEKQEIARQDATTGMDYLKCCIKEALRLSPTGGAYSRILQQDTIIGGYLIPNNTIVNAFTSVTTTDEKYFKNALEFNPERWMRNADEKYHKFASLPFGAGARMCPGKRIAESEIILLLKNILLSFEMEVVGDTNVGMVFRMNRIPEKPIRIRFTNTNH